jgi:hypothetical protein
MGWGLHGQGEIPSAQGQARLVTSVVPISLSLVSSVVMRVSGGLACFGLHVSTHDHLGLCGALGGWASAAFQFDLCGSFKKPLQAVRVGDLGGSRKKPLKSVRSHNLQV